MDESRNRVTEILSHLDLSDVRQRDELVALVYDELRVIAERQLRHERPGHTLQPTALVNEAYLRLFDPSANGWESRAHFFGVAARAMRQVLVDHARKRDAAKRGGELQRVTLVTDIAEAGDSATDVIELHLALEKLSQQRRRAGAAGRAAILRRADAGRGRRHARRVAPQGRQRLGGGAPVVAARAAGSAEWTRARFRRSSIWSAKRWRFLRRNATRSSTRALANDAEMLAEARSLLAEANATSFDALTARLGSRIERAAAELKAHPAQIGPYKILGVLGEGGMGCRLPRRADLAHSTRGGAQDRARRDCAARTPARVSRPSARRSRS